MEDSNEVKSIRNPRTAVGLSLPAALVITAILIFIGLHQVSNSVKTVEAGLNNQASALRLMSQSQTAFAYQFPPIMNLDQAATYLGITSEQVTYLAAPESGYQLPALKVGDEYRFSRAALDDWMKIPHRMDYK